MARTLINGPEGILSGSVTRGLLNTATSGSAVIAKVLTDGTISLGYTGADSGTGDVTLSLNQAYHFTFTNTITFSNTVTVGNSTANVVVTGTSLVLANSTNSLTINPASTLGGTGSVGGSNTQIQFNDSGSANGSAGFVFDKTSNSVTIANNLTVSGNTNITTAGFLIGNSTVNTYITSTSIVLANSTNSLTINPASTLGGGGGGVAGSNTQIQFNDSGSANASAAFTFNKSTNTVNIANNLTVAGNTNITTTSFSIGNSTVNTNILPTSITLSNNSNSIFIDTATSNISVNGAIVCVLGRAFAIAAGFSLT